MSVNDLTDAIPYQRHTGRCDDRGGHALQQPGQNERALVPGNAAHGRFGTAITATGSLRRET
jgi:hypothetical protein